MSHIAHLIDSITLIVIGLINLATVFVVYRTHVKVVKVEKATNSMKDELVKATGEAAHAKGFREGQIEERSELRKP